MPSPATAATDHKGRSAADLRRVRVRIAGDVQGVGFRAYTHAHAQGLGLTGYVTNLSNGQVEAVAEGPAGHIDQWLDRLRQGPEGSRVDQVTVTEEPPESQFTGFWMSD